MSLKRIGVKNFKSFSEYTEIDIRKLTLLSGLNSAGKSSIYQALLMLLQSLNNLIIDKKGDFIPELESEGVFYQIGAPQEIYNDIAKNLLIFIEFNNGYGFSWEFQYQKHYNEKKSILVGLEVSHDGESSYKIDKVDDQWILKAHNTLYFENQPIIIEALKYALDDKVLPNDYIFEAQVEFSNIKNIKFSQISLFQFDIEIGQIIKTLRPEILSIFDIKKFEERYNEILAEEIEEITIHNSNHRNEFNTIFGLTNLIQILPFRGLPQRVYSKTGIENPLIEHRKNYRHTVIKNYDFETKQAVKDSLEKSIKYWIVEYFKIADDFKIKTSVGGLVSEILILNDNKWIALNNVGFGVSQLLPIIFKTLDSHGLDPIIIDEPEIHLHPGLQTKLADFFFNLILAGKQIIIETHSEYIIDRLIFLMIKYEIADELISLLWVKKKKGKSFIEKIKFDSLGYIINAPDDFLSEKDQMIEKYSELRMSKISK